MNRKALKERLRGHSCDDCFLRTDATRLSSKPNFCLERVTPPEDNICDKWEEDYLSIERLMHEDRAEYIEEIKKAQKKQMIAAAVRMSKNANDKTKAISKWLEKNK